MPTSITVVETSIDIFLSKKSSKIFCFSSLSKPPCIRPTLLLNFFSIISNFFLLMNNLKKMTLRLKGKPKKFDYQLQFVFL